MKAYRTIRGAGVAVSLAALVAVAGCGTANTAAIVDGRKISESEAQETARQINASFELEKPLTTSDVVAQLIAAPFILDSAEKAGRTQSVSAAKAAMPKVTDPSESTIDLVRANFAIQGLDQSQQRAIIDALGRADVTVNPRFGTFDPGSVTLKPGTPNWLEQGDG